MKPTTVHPMPSPHAIGAAQLVAWGTAFYAIPPLLPRIMRDLSLSATSLSLAMTTGLVLSALGSVAVGAWIQRRGARTPMVAGTMGATLALIGLAASPSAAGVLACLALLGVTHAMLLYEPAFAAIGTQTLDPVRRVRSIQIITFWGGWAALWAIPAATVLADRWGWRATLVLFAVLLLAQTLPVHRRLQPVRVLPRRASACSVRLPRRLAVGFALGAYAATAIVLHGILLLTDQSVAAGAASMAFAMMAPVQIAGRAGYLGRRGRLAPHDDVLPFALLAGGLVALLAVPDATALVAFTILFGAGAGLMTTIRASLVATLVPADRLPVELGAMNLIISFARAAAPLGGAATYALLGFHGAVLVLVGCAVTGAALVRSVRPARACSPAAALACGVDSCAP